MSKLAVAYLRVSTATNQDGHGFDRQKQAIDEFADLGRFQLQKIFHEVWTGAEAERPALSEMLVFMEQESVGHIIVESSDRLARDLMVQFQILGHLRNKGVSVWNASTGDDMTDCMDPGVDPVKKAMVQVQAVFSELEKCRLVTKLRKARDAKFSALGRRCEGRPGVVWNDEVVILAKRLRRASRGRRKSLKHIASSLNEAGHRRPCGGQIKPHNVRSILGMDQRSRT